jgi:hypothetical protein
MVCLNCQRLPVCRPRGLCRPCHRLPEVRERFGLTDSKFNRRGHPPGTALPEPTHHLPGTPEKRATMEARVASGQLPFHPLDAQGDMT